jgi:hypothetical protein
MSRCHLAGPGRSTQPSVTGTDHQESHGARTLLQAKAPQSLKSRLEHWLRFRAATTHRRLVRLDEEFADLL